MSLKICAKREAKGIFEVYVINPVRNVVYIPWIGLYNDSFDIILILN